MRIGKTLFLSFIFCTCLSNVSAQWKPVGDRISSEWKDKVSPENAWKEYPRPQLVRENWRNLNGLWEYAIVAKGQQAPKKFQGKILVPYCVESSLSGVGKPLNPDQELWYKRSITIPKEWAGQNIVLHFGAVDYKTTVYINGIEVGKHTGGSDSFSFDISRFLKGDKQELTLKVWDPTDTDIQPRGKQALKPVGFWYTAVSGIWQTVWIEPVNETSIAHLNPIADIDLSSISLNSLLKNKKGDETVNVKISFKGKTVKQEEIRYQESLDFKLTDPQLWSPDRPNRYQLHVEVKRNGKILDRFDSYFLMRKIAVQEDENGYPRLYLNNMPLFQWGVLDQGWWPESLLTPPSDEAMKYDMEVLKDLGFNMIRKHIKVEPARFYYHADTMGLLVWQDMPSGFDKINHPEQHVKADATEDWKRPERSAKDFEAEWKSIMDNLRFFSSIVVWVPFNEGWGQYDTERIAEWTKNYDTSRLVNATSGWTDRKVGTMYDAHQYPGPSMEPSVQNPGRAIVLGEFGGLGWPIEGHLWDQNKRNWGYRTYQNKAEYIKEYSKVVKNVYPLISRGLSSAIYTQTTDVEGEVNGLMTYDRKVLKIPADTLRKLHSKLYATYTKAEFLVKDSEVEPSKMHITKVFPGEGWNTKAPSAKLFKLQSGPVPVKKESALWSVSTFTKKFNQKDLAMKIYAQGDLKVYLNGKQVYDKKILTKRHYDELNLSEFKEDVKEGENIIALELRNAVGDANFDYGVYEFGLIDK